MSALENFSLHDLCALISPWLQVPLQLRFRRLSREANGSMDTLASPCVMMRCKLRVGSEIDAQDAEGDWYEATVRSISSRGTKCTVFYRGWCPRRFADSIRIDSPRISRLHTHSRPLNICTVSIGTQLEFCPTDLYTRERRWYSVEVEQVDTHGTQSHPCVSFKFGKNFVRVLMGSWRLCWPLHAMTDAWKQITSTAQMLRLHETPYPWTESEAQVVSYFLSVHYEFTDRPFVPAEFWTRAWLESFRINRNKFAEWRRRIAICPFVSNF